jgi:hypothetical protein
MGRAEYSDLVGKTAQGRKRAAGALLGALLTIPDEEWMPPISSLLYKVRFYYKAASSATEFWEKAAKRWSKQVDKFAEPSPLRRTP